MKPMSALPNDVSATDSGLQDALRRFNTDVAELANERNLLPQAPKHRLESLLREIDETVLARKIKLRAEGAFFAAMTVSNRRLVGIHELDADGETAGTKKLSADVCAAWLTVVSEKVTNFTTEAVSLENTAASSDSSFPVATLRLKLEGGNAPSALAGLAQTLRSISIANINWTAGSQETRFHGEDLWRDFLASRSAFLRDQRAQKSRAIPETTAPTAFAVPLSDKTLLALVSDDKSGLAAILPSDTGMQALADWQKATAAAQS